MLTMEFPRQNVPLDFGGSFGYVKNRPAETIQWTVKTNSEIEIPRIMSPGGSRAWGYLKKVRIINVVEKKVTVPREMKTMESIHRRLMESSSFSTSSSL
jgi:formylmethanofuran dehydrogenase subunit A